MEPTRDFLSLQAIINSGLKSDNGKDGRTAMFLSRIAVLPWKSGRKPPNAAGQGISTQDRKSP
jgi:hypothetical protein